MQLNLAIQGIDRLRRELDALSGQKGRDAIKLALNDTGFNKLVPDVKRHLAQQFDRPTPWVADSPRVYMATAQKLEMSVGPSYWSRFGTKGGKAGVDPQQVLQAQQLGGQRRDKRSEIALRRAGILPAGMQLAIPATPFPGSDDGYGNINGSFMVQLISYFQAFGEQGYKANMSDRSRAAMRRYGTTKAPRRVEHGPRLGRRYIVSYGKARGGARTTLKGELDRRASNLPPGIWAVLGTTGAIIKPVVMFVRKGAYRPRIDLQRVGSDPSVNAYLSRQLDYFIGKAVQSA